MARGVPVRSPVHASRVAPPACPILTPVCTRHAARTAHRCKGRVASHRARAAAHLDEEVLCEVR
eukprot:CAMPEP_0119420530 /NCGR_PEP_ID=MMETSP1335-20130426/23733_1 /TAXON_ID=259385 /ORGANISM="Chrysoculter rhomboideus, Strain RCC1486" /LENGTH=63 /DNA_ID=CAMNT_0007445889 /DNA_START=69 /DNA_END=257 /DNA_ORIENTATION=-